MDQILAAAGSNTAAPQADGQLPRLIARWLRRMGAPPIGLRLWDGRAVAVTQTVAGWLLIRRPGALLRLLWDPELQFGDLYTEGAIGIDGDLPAMVEAVYRATAGIEAPGLWHEPRKRRPRRNSPRRARANIHHHYDLSNDFYRLWLDPELVYTCAYYADPAMDLATAQRAKLRHVCEKLRLAPGEQVIEAGCGWGALALYMAREYGVNVRAYNISREQLAHARWRAGQEGLDAQVEFIEGDYRDIDGACDAFACVGMLEHVGPRHYGALGSVIERCLKPGGRGLLHSIGRAQIGPINPWIERRIFPGGYPPTLREMLSVLEPGGFAIVDVENLRAHYARTLRHWLERFEAQADTVARLFDASFVRAWRLYLAGSAASFAVGKLDLFQITFARRDWTGQPWTRAGLYRDAP